MAPFEAVLYDKTSFVLGFWITYANKFNKEFCSKYLSISSKIKRYFFEESSFFKSSSILICFVNIKGIYSVSILPKYLNKWDFPFPPTANTSNILFFDWIKFINE